jgi:hypothetical protein
MQFTSNGIRVNVSVEQPFTGDSLEILQPNIWCSHHVCWVFGFVSGSCWKGNPVWNLGMGSSTWLYPSYGEILLLGYVFFINNLLFIVHTTI